MREVEKSFAEVAAQAGQATTTPIAEAPPAIVPLVQFARLVSPLVEGFARKEAKKSRADVP